MDKQIEDLTGKHPDNQNATNKHHYFNKFKYYIKATAIILTLWSLCPASATKWLLRRKWLRYV